MLINYRHLKSHVTDLQGIGHEMTMVTNDHEGKERYIEHEEEEGR
jgi:hypothetical protein